MPTSANITTSGALAFTIPARTKTLLVYNETDTEIRFRIGKADGVSATASAETTNTGIPIPAKVSTIPGSIVITFDKPLPKALNFDAVHGGSGNKVLTWDFLPH